jgi:hypothetical protein
VEDFKFVRRYFKGNLTVEDRIGMLHPRYKMKKNEERKVKGESQSRRGSDGTRFKEQSTSWKIMKLLIG